MLMKLETWHDCFLPHTHTHTKWKVYDGKSVCVCINKQNDDDGNLCIIKTTFIKNDIRYFHFYVSLLYSIFIFKWKEIDGAEFVIKSKQNILIRLNCVYTILLKWLTPSSSSLQSSLHSTLYYRGWVGWIFII